MRTLNQILAITAMNLRNLPQRVGTSLVVVVGIAGVVGVLVSVLAMSEGFRHTLASTGRGDRVILLRAGSDAELSSGVDRDQATLLAALPGIARDAAGRPQASAELVVMVDLPRKGESNPNNVPFRGVQRAAFTIRDEARRATARRAPAPLDERLADPGPTALEVAVGTDTLRHYEMGLARLTAAQREAVVLKVEMGYSNAEIAAALGKPSVDAVRMLLARALVDLAGYMNG